MDDDLQNLEWISSRERNRPQAKPVAPPKIDTEISQIVGKPILVNDRRLIKLITKWKQQKKNEDEFDEFLKDGAKIEELRKTFNPEVYGKLE